MCPFPHAAPFGAEFSGRAVGCGVLNHHANGSAVRPWTGPAHSRPPCAAAMDDDEIVAVVVIIALSFLLYVLVRKGFVVVRNAEVSRIALVGSAPWPERFEPWPEAHVAFRAARPNRLGGLGLRRQASRAVPATGTPAGPAPGAPEGRRTWRRQFRACCQTSSSGAPLPALCALRLSAPLPAGYDH